jgi:hypothetical protein
LLGKPTSPAEASQIGSLDQARINLESMNNKAAGKGAKHHELCSARQGTRKESKRALNYWQLFL